MEVVLQFSFCRHYSEPSQCIQLLQGTAQVNLKITSQTNLQSGHSQCQATVNIIDTLSSLYQVEKTNLLDSKVLTLIA